MGLWLRLSCVWIPGRLCQPNGSLVRWPIRLAKPFVVEAALLCFACQIASSPVWAQTQTIIKTNVNLKDGLTYIWIPPGTFQMGCSPEDSECDSTRYTHLSEKPAHTVTISKGFWIGQTPVTQAAYTKVVGTNPSHFK